jgi:hypothetical protein
MLLGEMSMVNMGVSDRQHPLGVISRVPQLSIIHSIFRMPPHQFHCLCCGKQTLQVRNYRETPHHLRSRPFLTISLHHGTIASLYREAWHRGHESKSL